MFKKLLAGTALLLGFSSGALAGAMYTFTPTGSLTGPADFAQGTLVQTNTAIVIDQIGVWVQNGNALTEDHGLRIRDLTNGVDLFVGLISAGTGTLLNGFRYIDIADISVAGGVMLAVMSDNRDGDNQDLQAFTMSGLAFDPSITLVESRFQNDTTVSTYPLDDSNGLVVIAGANLLINAAAVPVPGTLALILLGVLGLARPRLAARA